MLRHDVTKEVATRIAYTRTDRDCKQNKRFAGVEHEASFKLTQRPAQLEDSSNSIKSFFRATKREASIAISKKECKLRFKHVKKLSNKTEAQFDLLSNTTVATQQKAGHTDLTFKWYMKFSPHENVKFYAGFKT